MARSTTKIPGEQTARYEPLRKRRLQPKPKMQPPLTPMIDVTFQLLLFFLLTMTFRQAEGVIPGSLPQEAGITTASPVDLKPIVITIRPVADAAIYEMSGLMAEIPSGERLYAHLKARQDQLRSAEAPVVIRPEADVPWEYVVEAFSQSVKAKFKNVGFAPS